MPASEHYSLRALHEPSCQIIQTKILYSNLRIYFDFFWIYNKYIHILYKYSLIQM